MTLGKYPKFKDSGVEWIGEIPEGWKTSKLKEISDIRMSNIDKKSVENEPDVLLCNYIDVYNNDFISAKIEFMKATASGEQIKRLSLHKGDVLITKDSEEPTDIAIPAFVVEEINGLVSGYHLALITPNQRYVLGEYLFRSLQCSRINEQFVIQANGVTRFAIGTYAILNSKIFVPPVPEQKLIISYLDSETSKLQQLIDFKHRQIKLLQEHEKSLIHQAVTKGLDSNAKMKDSGVEWIGGMPLHYKISKLKKVAEYLNGLPFKPEEWEDEGLPIIRIQNLTDKEKPFNCYAGEFDIEYQINDGDLLISWSASIGVYRWNRGPAILNQHIFKVTTNSDVDNQFYFYLVSAALEEMISKTHGSTMTHIIDKHFRNFYIPQPTLEEQKQIAHYLDSETAKIHQAINNIEKSIAQLEEYRKALIYEVVTGKVKVS